MRFLLLPFLLGVAACTAPSEDGGEAEAAPSAASSTQDVAGAFAIQYAGLGGRFRDIPKRDLLTRLPEGDARTFAKCLAERDDAVKGETVAAQTWTWERKTYYVVDAEVRGNDEIRDPVMAFVFFDDGRSAFQALAWDGKRSVKISYGTAAPCPAPVATP